jgi:hypothetical protein
MYTWDRGANDAHQEQNTRMEANGRKEDGLQGSMGSIQDFDQSLSIADAFILHALGVKVAL